MTGSDYRGADGGTVAAGRQAGSSESVSTPTIAPHCQLLLATCSNPCEAKGAVVLRHQREGCRRRFAIAAVGGGSIFWARYGGTAVMTALSLLVGGVGVVALRWLLLGLMGAWARSG